MGPACWGLLIVAILQTGPKWGSQCDPHVGPARKPLVHFPPRQLAFSGQPFSSGGGGTNLLLSQRQGLCLTRDDSTETDLVLVPTPSPQRLLHGFVDSASSAQAGGRLSQGAVHSMHLCNDNRRTRRHSKAKIGILHESVQLRLSEILLCSLRRYS